MKVHAAALGFLALFAILGLVAAQNPRTREPDRAKPGEQLAASQDREPDVRAITELFASFVKTYNSKDPKALGALFTPEAEIEDEDGDITRGQDAIVARFADTFAGSEAGTLAVNTESLRFLGTDLAIEEGTASLTVSAGATPQTNRYSVIYARQGGRWLHARIRDEQPDEVSPHEQLLQLEWMLGEWVNESDDGIVKTHCKWSDNGNFLLREFDVKVEGRIALSGTQRIAWDAQRKQFRTWVFDDRGGFAEGLLSRDGDRWINKASGVRSDGQSVSTTSAFTALGKDRILWETLERTIGGEVEPGTDQYYLVRRAPLPRK
ncbi:MAG: YybH family protein [Isosphaeraceae bacterium]